MIDESFESIRLAGEKRARQLGLTLLVHILIVTGVTPFASFASCGVMGKIIVFLIGAPLLAQEPMSLQEAVQLALRGNHAITAA